jgi:hypothetical protein
MAVEDSFTAASDAVTNMPVRLSDAGELQAIKAADDEAVVSGKPSSQDIGTIASILSYAEWSGQGKPEEDADASAQRFKRAIIAARTGISSDTSASRPSSETPSVQRPAEEAVKAPAPVLPRPSSIVSRPSPELSPVTIASGFYGRDIMKLSERFERLRANLQAAIVKARSGVVTDDMKPMPGDAMRNLNEILMINEHITSGLLALGNSLAQELSLWGPKDAAYVAANEEQKKCLALADKMKAELIAAKELVYNLRKAIEKFEIARDRAKWEFPPFDIGEEAPRPAPSAPLEVTPEELAAVTGLEGPAAPRAPPAVTSAQEIRRIFEKQSGPDYFNMIKGVAHHLWAMEGARENEPMTVQNGRWTRSEELIPSLPGKIETKGAAEVLSEDSISERTKGRASEDVAAMAVVMAYSMC